MAVGEDQKPTTSDKAPAWENSNHPLHIHHSDQPRAILVPQLLAEDNFNSWIDSMNAAFQIKNKIGLVDGTLPKPKKNPDEQNQWNRCDILAKTWLKASMSKEIGKSFSHCKDSRTIWLELHERDLNLSHPSSLSSRAFGMRRKLSTTSLFVSVRHEKQAAVAANKSIMQPSESIAFQVQQQRGSQEPLAEPLATRGSGSSLEPFAGYARKSGRNDGKQQCCNKCDKTNHSTENCKAHLRCTTCNWKGHIAETCRQHLLCSYCGLKGHVYEDCRKRKAAQSGEGTSRVNHILAACEGSTSFPFSQAKCARLRELLDNSQAPIQAGKIRDYEELSGKVASLANNCCHTPTWLIDSGASDHIVCNDEFLTSKRLAMNYTVRLPSGSSAQVTHIGTVIFASQLKLENVLCVPSFYLNLISVSKLARDSFYVTIFLRQKVIRNVERKVLSNFGDDWRWTEFGRWPAAAVGGAGGGATTF
uniref:uncharacterized protein LOC101309778 n=1 Tax=Fragaria vesca subsp. vesca TaxID=101020 RepID=UPI0005C85D55|nr:PREDICTED: uncharacterized protein LOC101309778 [Fragaria vesca subsp. vesca]